MASRSGRNPFSLSSGTACGIPPAKLMDVGYTGYPGSVYRPTSPGSKNASGVWAMPSFEPMSATASVAGFKATSKRSLYHSVTASLYAGIPSYEG